jgi:hypothetical protein
VEVKAVSEVKTTMAIKTTGDLVSYLRHVTDVLSDEARLEDHLARKRSTAEQRYAGFAVGKADAAKAIFDVVESLFPAGYDTAPVYRTNDEWHPHPTERHQDGRPVFYSGSVTRRATDNAIVASGLPWLGPAAPTTPLIEEAVLAWLRAGHDVQIDWLTAERDEIRVWCSVCGFADRIRRDAPYDGSPVEVLDCDYLATK